MTTVRPEFNARGFLIEPDLHDACLVGIHIIRPHEISLAFESNAEELVDLTIMGIERFRATNFMEGNVVANLIVHDRNSVSNNMILRVLGCDADDDAKITMQEKYLPSTQERLSRGDLHLLEITSSYGCEIIMMMNSRPNDWIVTIRKKEA